MAACSKCGASIKEDAKFCAVCGAPAFKTVFCGNCGNETSTEFEYCRYCGMPLSAPPIPVIGSPETPKPPYAPDIPPVHKDKSKKRRGSKRLLLILGLIVLAAAAGLTAALFLFGEEKVDNYGLYIKGGEMYYADIDKTKSLKLTSGLTGSYDFDYDGSEDDDFVAIYELWDSTVKSGDGKLLLYPDFYTDDDQYTLCCRYINTPDKEPAIIDTSVSRFTMSLENNRVTYLKGEDDELYQYNFVDKDKLGVNVSHYNVSDDGEKVVFINSEGGIYLKCLGKDKEKIDSDASDLYSYFDNGSLTVYYIKDNSLYKKAEGKEKTVIASNVDMILDIYETGEIYYLKKAENNNVMNYVEDDMKAADAKTTIPDEPEYPDWLDYETTEEWDAAYEQYEADCDAYEQAYDAYDDKCIRDNLREWLADWEMLSSVYTLCYYSGSGETVMTDTFFWDIDYVTSLSKPAIAYHAFDKTDIKKVKLSEIYSDDGMDYDEMIDEAIDAAKRLYIANKDHSTVVSLSSVDSLAVDNEGNTLFYTDNVSDDEAVGDLYKVDFSGDTVNKPELFDSDVSTAMLRFVADDMLIYFKDAVNDKGDLYINKEKIDFDVNLYYFSYCAKKDTLVYFTDWDEENEAGTLKTYSFANKGADKVAYDVHSYDTKPNGEILYLSDYSSNYNAGELFVCKNGKSRLIDSDVTAILSYGLLETYFYKNYYGTD